MPSNVKFCARSRERSLKVRHLLYQFVVGLLLEPVVDCHGRTERGAKPMPESVDDCFRIVPSASVVQLCESLRRVSDQVGS